MIIFVNYLKNVLAAGDWSFLMNHFLERWYQQLTYWSIFWKFPRGCLFDKFETIQRKNHDFIMKKIRWRKLFSRNLNCQISRLLSVRSEKSNIYLQFQKLPDTQTPTHEKKNNTMRGDMLQAKVSVLNRMIFCIVISNWFGCEVWRVFIANLFNFWSPIKWNTTSFRRIKMTKWCVLPILLASNVIKQLIYIDLNEVMNVYIQYFLTFTVFYDKQSAVCNGNVHNCARNKKRIKYPQVP